MAAVVAVMSSALDVVRAYAVPLDSSSDVRRVPVLGFSGTVLGIVAMNDIVLAAGRGKKSVLSAEVIDTLQPTCGHHQPAHRGGAD